MENITKLKGPLALTASLLAQINAQVQTKYLWNEIIIYAEVRYL